MQFTKNNLLYLFHKARVTRTDLWYAVNTGIVAHRGDYRIYVWGFLSYGFVTLEAAYTAARGYSHAVRLGWLL